MMNTLRQTLTLILIATSANLCSQRMSIGTQTPHASAILDITSTEQGLLIPRMTTTQRISVGAITTGLMVFDSTTSSLWYAEMNNWTELRGMWIRNGNNIYNANAGNVGIGTSAPIAKLEVLGSIRASQPGNSPSGSFISLSSPSNDPGIILVRGNGSGGQARRWDIKVDNDESFKILDNTAGKLRMRATSDGGVVIGTAATDASAALDIQSSTKGFLPPRLTLQQRYWIASPAEGLLIWCMDCGVYGEVQIFNGAFWTNMIGEIASGIEIGDFYGGGIVAYVYQPGDPGYVAGEIHGIIALQNDINAATWGCNGTDLPGCEGLALGTGGQNTIDIINGCGTAGIAADQCVDLQVNGLGDWVLPSLEELEKLFANQDAIGGFADQAYWSSSEINANNAYSIGFEPNGQTEITLKSTSCGVRPIRYF